MKNIQKDRNTKYSYFHANRPLQTETACNRFRAKSMTYLSAIGLVSINIHDKLWNLLQTKQVVDV